jgi:hypothetical protein
MLRWVIIAGLLHTLTGCVQTRHAFQGYGYRAQANPKPVCTTVRGNVTVIATCTEDRRP